MSRSATIQVRVDPATKDEASRVMAALGLTMSQAVDLFLHQVVLRGGLPFEVVLPDARGNTEQGIDVSEIKRLVEPVCRRYGVERLALFGSRARGTATSKSDFDFRLDRGQVRGMDFFALKHDLEEALGAKVDLVTTESLSDTFARTISEDEVTVYAA